MSLLFFLTCVDSCWICLPCPRCSCKICYWFSVCSSMLDYSRASLPDCDVVFLCEYLCVCLSGLPCRRWVSPPRRRRRWPSTSDSTAPPSLPTWWATESTILLVSAQLWDVRQEVKHTTPCHMGWSVNQEIKPSPVFVFRHTASCVYWTEIQLHLILSQ